MTTLKDIRKIHLVGDLHLGIKNNAIEWLEIQKSFLLEDLIEKVDFDFDEARDILIFEGDIFHSRESVNIRIQNESFAIFAQLAKKFKRGVYIILGNHDVYYKDKNTVNSVKSLSYLSDNIHVFERSEILSINGKHNFLMLPWVDDYTRLAGIIEDNRDDADYIICHADIKGLTLNKWAKVEHGIELSALSTFKKVYSGHIHIRQEKANLLYTGTPYQMDRGDRDNQKGHYVLDVTGDQIIEEFLPNVKSPVFLKLDIFEILEMPLADIEKMFRNNFIDVMISVSFASKLSITSFLEKIQDTGYRKIEFFTYVDAKPEEQTTQVEFDLQDNFNINDIFSHYLTIQNYTEPVKEALTEKFLETLQKVRELDKYA
jgi:DNA repair exonuclease SbcCD nuclease subunit